MASPATGLKRRRNRRRRSAGLPRGFAMGIVLLVCTGLAGWYFRGALDDVFAGSTQQETAADEREEPKERKSAKKPPQPAPVATEDAGRFEFYEMLPDAEVDVPKQPQAARGAPPSVSVPGTYIVQAGAFPDVAEAGKVKTRLATLGIAAEIQVADANGQRFHRVRIGPIDNLDQLNRLRARLRANGIPHLVIPVGE